MEPDRSKRHAAARMMELAWGSLVTQAASVVATLGVADELADGPREVGELAGAVGAHGPSLHRVLRVLADYDLVQELPGRRFALTATGAPLRRDVPGSLRGLAIYAGMPFRQHAVTGLLASVRTGKPAFEQVHGQSLFEYLQEHPDAAAAFDAAMADLSRVWIAPVVDAYDFSPFSRVVDVGGGTGALLAAILSAHPDLRGTLFDLPHVVGGAERHLTSAGVGDRCEVVAGDFFDGVPAGGDAYLLANVIHDWDDEHAVRILRNCRAAIGTHGRVLLAEEVLPDTPSPSLTKLMDLAMLVITPDGRQRTPTQYRALFERAGLRLSRVLPGGSTYSVVEALAA
jgi:O-methyltransferase domain